MTTSCASTCARGRFSPSNRSPRRASPPTRCAIDFGEELGERRSSAQITGRYTEAELVGTQICAVVNFPPKRIAGFESEVLVSAWTTTRQRHLGATDLSGPQRPAAVLMTATTAGLDIRCSTCAPKAQSFSPGSPRLLVDAYPIMYVDSTMPSSVSSSRCGRVRVR